MEVGIRKLKVQGKCSRAGRKFRHEKCKCSRAQCTSSITVFLAMTFICMVSLVLSLVESAHTAGCRYYVQNAADAAIDSVFSEYCNELWNDYRLLFLDTDDYDELENKLIEYIEPYSASGNYYAMNDVNAKLVKYDTATDGGGEWLEQEIIDYMKFGIAEEIKDLLTDSSGKSADDADASSSSILTLARQMEKDLSEAETMEQISENCNAYTKEALKVEEAIDSINTNLKEQSNLKAAAISALKNKNSSKFKQKARQLSNKMSALDTLIKTYEKRADALSKKINSTHAAGDVDYDSLSDESKNLVEHTLESYRDYADKDGERRIEIESLNDNKDHNQWTIDRAISDVEDIDEAVEEAREAYAEALAEARAAAEEGGGPIEIDFDPDELEPDYDDVIDDFHTIKIPSLNCKYGTSNDGKKKLDKIEKLLGGDLITLVLPDGNYSKVKISKDKLPSINDTTLRTTNERNIAENYAIAEYATQFFADYTDDTEETKDDHVLSYELEYLLNGGDGDADALKKTIGDIFAVREGMNYIHILKNAEKRRAAEEFAATIVGSLGMPVLIPVVSCMLIGFWAAAESVLDLRLLLSGGKVPVYKNNADWKLGISGLMSLGEGGTLGSSYLSSGANNSDGLSYETYIKFLLLTVDSKDRNYRMMDIIQSNIRKKNKDFTMNDAIYGMKYEVSAKANHIFAIRDEFEISTTTVRAY